MHSCVNSLLVGRLRTMMSMIKHWCNVVWTYGNATVITVLQQPSVQSDTVYGNTLLTHCSHFITHMLTLLLCLIKLGYIRVHGGPEWFWSITWNITLIELDIRVTYTNQKCQQQVTVALNWVCEISFFTFISLCRWIQVCGAENMKTFLPASVCLLGLTADVCPDELLNPLSRNMISFLNIGIEWVKHDTEWEG